MTRSLRLVLLVLSLPLVGPSVAHSLEEADLPQAVETARTPADHAALAAYFGAEAKAARARAERHRRMADLYARYPQPSGTEGTRASLSKTMPPHCNKLVASYEAAAAEYEAMAAAHRAIAGSVE